jgi:3-oxoacyl-[acyl-carrier protein] reductase
MSFDLDLGLAGKVVLVTGAGGGIGLSTVQAFLAAGASVVATDMDITSLQELFAVNAADDILLVKEDISNIDACKKLISQTIEHFGQVDILINCAALIKRVDLADIDEELWDRHMDINLKSTFFLSKFASENMRLRSWGRIINMTSQAGHTGGAMDCVAYATTKGGINTLTKSFAKHNAQFGITVNAVSPGLVNTKMITGTLPEEAINDLIALVPIKRLSDVKEIAAPILFLSSKWADSITGLTLDVNGGMLMR